MRNTNPVLRHWKMGDGNFFDVVKYELPVYWASYLINGDDSGLEDGEKAQIDRWLKREGSPEIVDVGEDTWFAHDNDATNMGGDVAEYTAHVRTGRERNPSRRPSISSDIYQRRQKMPRWNVQVSPLSADYSTGGKILRGRLPDYDKSSHLAAGDYYAKKSYRLEEAHRALVESASRKLGGDLGPLISGIVSDKFDEGTKDALRKYAYGSTEHAHAALAHYRAAGMQHHTALARFRSFERQHNPPMLLLGNHSGSSVQTMRGPNPLEGNGFHVMKYGAERYTSVGWYPTRAEAQAEVDRIKMVGAWSGAPPKVEASTPPMPPWRQPNPPMLLLGNPGKRMTGVPSPESLGLKKFIIRTKDDGRVRGTVHAFTAKQAWMKWATPIYRATGFWNDPSHFDVRQVNPLDPDERETVYRHFEAYDAEATMRDRKGELGASRYFSGMADEASDILNRDSRGTLGRKPQRGTNPPYGPADPDAARELELFIENDGDLYRGQFKSIVRNLMTKWARGTYDRELAVQLFMYLMESGAKKYNREFGSGEPIDRVFNRNTRLEVARRFRDAFEAEARAGEYGDEYLPKKYAGFRPNGGRGRNPLDQDETDSIVRTATNHYATANKAEDRGEERYSLLNYGMAAAYRQVARSYKQPGVKLDDTYSTRVLKEKRPRNNPGGPTMLPPAVENDPRFKKELASYRAKHGNDPVAVYQVDVPKGFPKFMTAWGTTPEILYDATKASTKGKRRHEFGEKGGKPPYLVSSQERGPKFLAFVGGTFKAGKEWILK